MSESQSQQTPPVVLKVAEGVRIRGAASRTFSVVMSCPCDDLVLVATARDPKSGAAIPPAGEGHPDDDNLIARPPMVYPVGRREVGGVLTATRSSFYNVRVRYVPREA